ncbi:hypothetical protein EXN66_Car000807 [Channa argus]|uniref:Transposase Tc1-like domain-containing protein n=1 Tax=Channa argus TaxID=215402 RepID=A0A6G1QYR4_CHAAH|nr:hypothetical protein EXN66_Car000807 [Channa argus]KAK2921279.1 hypothetical protein Q8A73_000764 [Channa argus]
MGKSRDLSEFERGMIVGARSAGCSISETVKRLGFSKTAVSRVYREWCEKQKTSSHRGSCGRKRLVDENGEKRIARMVESNNQATTVQIQTLYNSSGQEKPISLTTTRRTLKRLGYDRRVQQRDSLVLAGLEALAVYTSCPEPLDTSADFVDNTENHPDPKIQSSDDAVCSTENNPDPKIQTSVDAVCSTESHLDPQVQTSWDAVCNRDNHLEPWVS